MSNIKDIQTDFQRDIKDFKMEIELDQGVNRSILFINKNGSLIRHFRLNTWHNHLCISGDMGSYVFCRLPDMFQFFRTDEGRINAGYWGQKAVAVDESGGIREFSVEETIAFALEWVDGIGLDEEEAKTAKENLKEEMGFDEESCRNALEGFVFKSKNGNTYAIDEWHEYLVTAHTRRYLWCCHAIAWGIEQYEKSKAEVN